MHPHILEKTIARMNELGKRKTPFLFCFDFDLRQPRVWETSEIDPSRLLFAVGEQQNFERAEPPKFSEEVRFSKKPIHFEAYAERFEQALRHIRLGDSFLLNLTCPTEVETNLSLREIFFRARAAYKLWWADERVVFFSPETFVKIRDGHIISCPMKGTIDASLPDAEARILADPKETAEHFTIVDLIRNDLSMVAREVRVEQFRYVERVETLRGGLLQVSSRIGGRLPRNWRSQIGSIMARLLPAGSISGAPKEKTVEIIRAAERYERGWYTGVFGWFDGESLDSGVMIRFLEETPDGKLIFKSGGGITAWSDCAAEFREMIDKVYLPFRF